MQQNYRKKNSFNQNAFFKLTSEKIAPEMKMETLFLVHIPATNFAWYQLMNLVIKD